jgi:hypothetical protein
VQAWAEKSWIVFCAIRQAAGKLAGAPKYTGELVTGWRIPEWRARANERWRRSPSGVVVVVMLWLAATVSLALVAVEMLLQQRSAYLEARDTRRYSVLARAYAPFMTESLHPQYLFFFPPTATERLAIGNSTCRIDRHGFREPGVEQAGGRRVAFLVGGSVAFGLFASADNATITSYLNRLQQDYFFVNAGVPGFNSTQELVRLTVELADYQPALVVALDGWNDLTLAREPDWIERGIPAGTPEAFPALEEQVAAAQSPWRDVLPEKWFPEISLRLAPRQDEEQAPPVPAARLNDAVERYTINHERMAAVSRSIGARFISVFQPLASLHRNIEAHRREEDPAAELFHQKVREKLSAAVEFHDMSRVFDAFFPVVPIGVPEIDDQTIFVDNGHLYDPGNEIVARELLKLIQRAPASTR